jgi:hypothetical protein
MDRRCFLKSLTAAPAVCLGRTSLIWTELALAQQRDGMSQPDPFKPSEGANNPVGEARGVHPGRVVWVRDANSTSWDGKTGYWWDDANTDQKVVNRVTSRLLLDLTGQKNEKQAWDALFRYHNQARKLGDSGYRRGEKIAIKINCNQDRGPDWSNMVPSFGPPPGGAARLGGPPEVGPPGGARGGGPLRGPQNGLPSPHVLLALVSQLINAGVPGEDILLYDVAGRRNIGQPIYSKIRAESNRHFQAVKFLVNTDYGLGGRLAPTVDRDNPVQFSNPEVPTAYLAQEANAAKYMINVALLRPHGIAGVTLIGKNHFGCVHFPDNGGWTPAPLHSYIMRTRPMGSYNALVDLMGHRQLGGKTVLYMLDGLYTAEHNEGNVFRFASFGDDWASSLLMSQDPVAIDSVGLDILRSETRADVRGNADNYLHEAAQSGKPASGTVYNPDKSGQLASLGVHEHWNNATERKYSRNLGRREGIELIAYV